MKKLSLSITFLMAALSVLPEPIEALEAVASKNRQTKERAVDNAVLTSITTTLKTYIDPIMRCQSRNLIYMPNHPDKDANGCVDPLARIKKCFALGKIYHPSPTLVVDEHGCIVPEVETVTHSYNVAECTGPYTRFSACSSSINIPVETYETMTISGDGSWANNSGYGHFSGSFSRNQLQSDIDTGWQIQRYGDCNGQRVDAGGYIIYKPSTGQLAVGSQRLAYSGSASCAGNGRLSNVTVTVTTKRVRF